MKIREIISNKKIIFHLIIIFLASLTFLNFLRGHYYSMWDLTIPPFNPDLQIEKALSLWDHSFLGGRYYVFLWSLPIFFAAKIFNIFLPENLGLNLWFTFLFFLSGVGMYIFFYSSAKVIKKNLPRFSLIAALLYMFNPFWIFRLNTTFYTLYIFAFLPLFLFFINKAITCFNLNKKKSIQFIILSSIITFLMIPGLGNIPVAFATFLFCSIYFFVWSLFNKKFLDLLKVSLILMPLMFMIHFWWFMPNLNHSAVKEGLAREGSYQEDTLGGIKWWSDTEYVSYYNILRNMAYWIRPQEKMTNSWGELWTENTEFFTGSFMILISFIVPIISFLILFSKSAIKKSDGLIFVIILLIFTPLFALLKPPFGGVVKAIFSNIFFYILRRPPSYMFIFSFCFAYMFSLGAYVLSINIEKIKNIKIKNLLTIFFIVSILLAIFIIPFPQWVSSKSYMNLMGQDGKITPVSSLVDPPGYAKDATNFLNSQEKGGGVLVLPRAGMLRGYDWENGYFGWDYYYLSLNRPVLSFGIDRYKMFLIYRYLDGLLRSESPDDFAKVLSKFNIRYVLLAEDFVRHKDTRSFDIDLIKQKLGSKTNLNLIKNFERVNIYENELCDKFCKDFYFPKQVIKNPGELNKKLINHPLDLQGEKFLDLKKNPNGSVSGWYDYNQNRISKGFSLTRIKGVLDPIGPVNSINLTVYADKGISLGFYLGNSDESELSFVPYSEGGKLFSEMNPNGSERTYKFEVPNDIRSSEYLFLFIKANDQKQPGKYFFNIKKMSYVLGSDVVSLADVVSKYVNSQDVFNEIDYSSDGKLKESFFLNKEVPYNINKINETSYEIKFNPKNIDHDFIISSNLIFNDNWVASIDEKPLDHIRINEIFNGWIISQKDLQKYSEKEIVLKINFPLQQKMESNMKLSFSVLIGSIILAILMFFIPDIRKKNKLVISFSGVDGAGKTTQIELLKKYLNANNISYSSTHLFSKNSSVVSKIHERKIMASLIKKIRNAKEGRASDFLKISLRLINVLVDSNITPAFNSLKRKENVIIYDRYFYDVLAVLASDFPAKQNFILKFSKFFKKPDIVIFLNPNPQETVRRKGEQTKYSAEIFSKIYSKIAEINKIDEIKSNNSIENIHEEIIKRIISHRKYDKI